MRVSHAVPVEVSEHTVNPGVSAVHAVLAAAVKVTVNLEALAVHAVPAAVQKAPVNLEASVVHARWAAASLPDDLQREVSMQEVASIRGVWAAVQPNRQSVLMVFDAVTIVENRLIFMVTLTLAKHIPTIPVQGME